MGSYHRGMGASQVVDVEGGLQFWTAASKILK